jgi:hypothetical protein
MAGNVKIPDRMVPQDFHNIEAVGIEVTIELDPTHGMEKLHLDFRLTFPDSDPDKIMATLSQLSQKYGRTYKKLRVGDNIEILKRRATDTYEVKAGERLLKRASKPRYRKLKELLSESEQLLAQNKRPSMIPIKF